LGIGHAQTVERCGGILTYGQSDAERIYRGAQLPILELLPAGSHILRPAPYGRVCLLDLMSIRKVEKRQRLTAR
jgi:hypothetical protein